MGLFDITTTQPDMPRAFEKASTLETYTFVVANILKQTARPSPKRRPDGSKEALYAALDPTLALLFKDWKCAQSQYASLVDSFGEDDPMLDVAIDRLDAARLSFETRLLEVKADKALFVQAEKLWEEELECKDGSDSSESEALRLEELKQIQENWFALIASQKVAKQRNTGSNFLLWALLYIMLFSRSFNNSLQNTSNYNRAFAA